MPKTYCEQEGILFFKLYLLARHKNYIDYMAQTRALATWFSFKEQYIDRNQQAGVYCGNCFGQVLPNTINGGGILHTCIGCEQISNWGYELNRLEELTGLSFHTCMYLLCKAVEDIFKYGTIEQSRQLTYYSTTKKGVL